jgi:hypothetical protein
VLLCLSEELDLLVDELVARQVSISHETVELRLQLGKQGRPHGARVTLPSVVKRRLSPSGGGA